MYRITINSHGKYNNVCLGARYCFRKKSAKELIGLFLNSGCEIVVEKFVRLTSDVFAWSDCGDDDSVIAYFEDKLWEIEEAEIEKE